MTHQIPNAAVQSQAKQVKARITKADAKRVWRPSPSLPLVDLEVMTTPMIVAAGVFSTIGISFMMAWVGSVLPTDLAPLGMAAVFYLGIVVSGIYWPAYIRQQHLHDSVDALVDYAEELEDRVLEMEHGISEKLDVIERNV